MCRQLPTFFAVSLCLPLSHTHTHFVWEDGCVWLHVYLRASVCDCVCPSVWMMIVHSWVGLLWLQFCTRCTRVAVRSFVQLAIGVIHHNIIGHQLAHSTQPSPSSTSPYRARFCGCVRVRSLSLSNLYAFNWQLCCFCGTKLEELVGFWLFLLPSGATLWGSALVSVTKWIWRIIASINPSLCIWKKRNTHT